jgi:citrate lyase subunit beta/citryl-CoA lyase
MRSLLFVPGDRPERFAKALASGADAVICDLEDAVTPQRVQRARQDVAELLRTTTRAMPLWVRINPVQTDDALPDLVAVVAARPDGIVLPKARMRCRLAPARPLARGSWNSARSCARLDQGTGADHGNRECRLNGATFATPPARVIGYTWGAEDLAADVGARPIERMRANSNSRFAWLARRAC